MSSSSKQAQVPVVLCTERRCRQHPERQLVMTCTTCMGELVCLRCISVQHAGHTFKEIEEDKVSDNRDENIADNYEANINENVQHTHMSDLMKTLSINSVTKKRGCEEVVESESRTQEEQAQHVNKTRGCEERTDGALKTTDTFVEHKMKRGCEEVQSDKVLEDVEISNSSNRTDDKNPCVDVYNIGPYDSYWPGHWDHHPPHNIDSHEPPWPHHWGHHPPHNIYSHETPLPDHWGHHPPHRLPRHPPPHCLPPYPPSHRYHLRPHRPHRPPPPCRGPPPHPHHGPRRGSLRWRHIFGPPPPHRPPHHFPPPL